MMLKNKMARRHLVSMSAPGHKVIKSSSITIFFDVDWSVLLQITCSITWDSQNELEMNLSRVKMSLPLLEEL